MSEDKVSGSDQSSPEVLGGSPGTILRRCREFHGITLDEASESTKIGLSHLKALEDDLIHEFANQVYLKGFLRIYAAYLGLNSDDIARLYDKLFGVQSEKPDTVRSSAATRPQRRLIPFKKMVFPALLLVVILITATFFRRLSAPPLRQTQPVAAVAVVPLQPNTVIQQVQSSARSKRVEQDIPSPKAERHPAESPDSEKVAALKRSADMVKGFILKIKVNQNGTLTVAVDGSGPQPYDLAIGDVIEWKAEKKVALELSNAGGVDVELNGKPYKQLGAPGKPAYVEIDADGINQ